MVRLTGNFYTSAGVATCGAAVAIFPVSEAATQSTSVCDATATTTTNSTGVWDELALAANTYDVRITSGSSVRWRRYNEEVQHTTFQTGDDGNFYLGNGIDVGHRWSTGDASNHAYVIGIGDTSQQMHITDLGAIATDWARSAGTHPELAIHSNTTPITDYIAIGNHDGTTGNIDVVGGTTLALKIAGNTEASITAAGLVLPACSDLSFTGTTGTNDIVLTNGLADALSITDGSADIILVDTSTSGNVITMSSAVTVGADGSGTDVIFYSATAGDNMTWDASAKQMVITGTACTTALNVADGNVTIADNLTVSGNLTVTGTTNSVNSTTICVTNAFVFEGACANAHETTLAITEPTADATINLPAMAAGTYYLPVLAAATTATITSTPAELNFLDGSCAGTVVNSKAVVYGSGGEVTASSLTVDDVAVNGKVVTMTGSACDTIVMTAAANGAFSLVTTDAVGAAGNIQITADGTVDIDSAGVLTLDSGAAINIEPAAGSAILLDGTISIDAGVVTGATSITSTAFVGALSTAAQTNITSLGTLTALTVDDVAVDGKVVTMTGSACDTIVMTAAANGAFSLVTTDAAAAAANIQITADGTVDIDSAGVLTLDSGAAINIEPAACSAVLIDGTVSIDGGAVTGVTDLTASGALSGATIAGNMRASIAQTDAGTSTALAVTPDGLAGSVFGQKTVVLKIISETTVLTTCHTGLFTVPSTLCSMHLTDADAAVYGVSSSGTPTVQIHNLDNDCGATDMLSTVITIDACEFSSYTAGTAPVVDTCAAKTVVDTGDRLRIDVDVAGTGTDGLDVILTFEKVS